MYMVHWCIGAYHLLSLCRHLSGQTCLFDITPQKHAKLQRVAIQLNSNIMYLSIIVFIQSELQVNIKQLIRLQIMAN